jgi:hypothetical protein
MRQENFGLWNPPASMSCHGYGTILTSSSIQHTSTISIHDITHLENIHPYNCQQLIQTVRMTCLILILAAQHNSDKKRICARTMTVQRGRGGGGDRRWVLVSVVVIISKSIQFKSNPVSCQSGTSFNVELVLLSTIPNITLCSTFSIQKIKLQS